MTSGRAVETTADGRWPLVRCPSCSTGFPVDPEKVPEAGIFARCSTCAEVFPVARPEWPPARPPVDVAPGLDFPDPFAPPPPAEVRWPSFSDFSRGVDLEDEPEVEAPPPEDARESGVEEEVDPATEDALEAVVREEADPSAEEATRAVPGEDAAPATDIPAAAVADDDVEFVLEGDTPPEPPVQEEASEVEPFTGLPESARAALSSAPTFGRQDPHERAARIARVLVSDMMTYHRKRYERAVEEGTLQEEFEDEVGRSWEEYVDRVGPEMAEGTTYFRDALNEIFARGESIY